MIISAGRQSQAIATGVHAMELSGRQALAQYRTWGGMNMAGRTGDSFRMIGLVSLALMFVAPPSFGQDGASVGPYQRMVIRGATMIDGTGAPSMGSVDIVVEGDKIVEVKRFGYAKRNQQLNDEDLLKGADHVIEAQGMYVTPGFIDLHRGDTA